MRTYRLLTLAGILGLTGVIIGAFGAHLLKERLAAPHLAEIWEKGVVFQLIHAAALLAIAVASTAPDRASERWLLRAGYCWALGVLLFSGSLYSLALGLLPRIMGPITPLGGVLMIVGWSFVIVAGIHGSRKAPHP